MTTNGLCPDCGSNKIETLNTDADCECGWAGKVNELRCPGDLLVDSDVGAWAQTASMKEHNTL